MNQLTMNQPPYQPQYLPQYPPQYPQQYGQPVEEQAVLPEAKKSNTLKGLLGIFLLLVIVVAVVLCIIYIPKSKKFTSGDRNWKYTDDPNDPDCLRNWDYVSKDGKIIEPSIKVITKTNDQANWCAIKTPIHVSGKDKWKYTEDKNDPECLKNWDYYKSDRKTSILKNILNITKANDKKNWCSLK